jgi:hypothetical protein
MKYSSDCIECDFAEVSNNKVQICPECCSTKIAHSIVSDFQTENSRDVYTDRGSDENI